MATAPMHSQTTHDVFITDVDYDADEKELGLVQTGVADETVGSTLISLQIPPHQPGRLADLDPAQFEAWIEAQFDEVKEQSIVRFTTQGVHHTVVQ